MKLIDGHALADRLLSDAITTDQRRQANMIAKVIEEMPEVQPDCDDDLIIRCRDCKHSQKADEFVHCRYVAWWNSKEDFCSRAERKEGGAE